MGKSKAEVNLRFQAEVNHNYLNTFLEVEVIHLSKTEVKVEVVHLFKAEAEVEVIHLSEAEAELV